MRILLYLEPFPLRRSFTSLAGVAESIGASLLAGNAAQDGATIRLYANRQTLDAFLRRHPQLSPDTLSPTEQEQALFEGHYAEDWDVSGIDRWQELMGDGPLAETYLKVLEDIHRRAPFDILVYWGTNGAARAFSQEHGIPAIALELGCTRPPYLDSLVADPDGVNGDSIFTKVSAKDIATICGEDPWIPTLPPLPSTSAAMTDILHRAGGKPIAYLPLQLYDDANLLRFSPYASMEEFLREVLPPLQRAGYFLLVKDHPAAFQRLSGTMHSKACAAYLATFADSHWLPDHTPVTNLECFALAQLVVTVNSSVGFEASLYGQPVAAMGDACYKLPGFFPTLIEVLDKEFDLSAYRRRLRALHGFFFRAVLQPKTGASSREYFLHRIQHTAGLWQAHKHNPTAYAREAYKVFAQTPPITENPSPRRGLKSFLLSHPALLRTLLPLWRKLRRAPSPRPTPPARRGAPSVNAVCAVIVTYHINESFPALFEAIRTQVGHSVFVDNSKDNGVSHRILTALRDAHPHAVTLISNPENNLAIAQNLGIEAALKAGYDWVLLMDHDSLPAPDMVSQMLHAQAKDAQPESIGLLAPFVQNRGTDSAPRLRARRADWYRCRPNKAAPVVENLHCVIASGSLIPRHVLLRMRMDESLVIDSVDTDFCLRLRAQGLRILAIRDAKLTHSIGEASRHRLGPLTLTTTNHSPLRRYYQSRNRILLWKRYATRFPSFVLYDMMHGIYEFIRIQCFEQQKAEKDCEIIAGIRDALRGVTGYRPER